MTLSKDDPIQLPDKVETEYGDYFTHERREIDILYDLVTAVNQIIDYLAEQEKNRE